MRETCHQNLQKCFVVPHRYIIGIMGCFAILTSYTMRISLSVAITEMVLPKNSSNKTNPDACPVIDYHKIQSVKDNTKLYNWNEERQGLILSSFYWSYVITHIPGGILSEQFGGKYVLGISMLLTAIFTLVTPYSILATEGNFWVLIALRVALGLCGGSLYPAINTILGQWVPAKEKAFISSLTFTGAQLGIILTNSISGVLIQSTTDWGSVFYLFGTLGVLWYIIWQLICYSSPNTHPFISDKEKEFLAKELAGHVNNQKKKVPWKAIFTSVPFWALVFAQIGHDWGWYTMVTDLPKYMKDVLKFDVQQNGFLSSLPFILMWIVAMGIGFLCDWLITNNKMTITATRKLFSAIANIGPGIFMVSASYVGCDRYIAVALFTISMGLMGPYYAGLKVNCLDLAPNFAGTLMALVNGIGVIAGILAPYLVGALTPDQSLNQWRLVFWISFGVLTLTTVFYLFFGTGEEQLWNQVEPSPAEENK